MKFAKCKVPFLGVFLAFFNAMLGTMQECARYFFGTNLPFMSSAIYYLLSSLLILLPSGRKLKLREYGFPSIAGLVDAIATVSVVYAYRFASVATVLLLVSLSTPLSMLFYYAIFRRRMRLFEVLTALLAFVFAGIFVCGDFKFGGNFSYQGVLLSLASAVAYGLGGVLNEKFSAGMRSTEYLARMSAAPFVLSAVLFFVLELRQLARERWQGIALSVAFSVCMVFFYFVAILVLYLANAVFFNVALILTNLFTFPVSVLLFKQHFIWPQIVCAVLLAASIVAHIYCQRRREEEEAAYKVCTEVVSAM